MGGHYKHCKCTMCTFNKRIKNSDRCKEQHRKRNKLPKDYDYKEDKAHREWRHYEYIKKELFGPSGNLQSSFSKEMDNRVLHRDFTQKKFYSSADFDEQ